MNQEADGGHGTPMVAVTYLANLGLRMLPRGPQALC